MFAGLEMLHLYTLAATGHSLSRDSDFAASSADNAMVQWESPDVTASCRPCVATATLGCHPSIASGPVPQMTHEGKVKEGQGG
jgi:hypothetical protein